MKSPPNYLRRGNQWRLLVLVASLMLVLVLMEEARDPMHYRWMWGSRGPEEPVSDPDFVEIATRSDAHERHRTGDDRASHPLGGDDAWDYAVGQLTEEERTAMRQTLRSARRARALPAEYRAAAQSAIDRLVTAWETYLVHARKAVAPPDETASPESELLATWEQLEQYWLDSVQPALDRIRPHDEDDFPFLSHPRDTLLPLQQGLDQHALSKVRDNTPFGFAEREAWFRLIEQMRAGELPTQDRTHSYVSYLQLLDQAEVYRGQWVRVRGEARLGYRVDAPENDLGIEHYFVIWLKPDDGTNSPITLYSLNLPEDFPAVADKTATGAMTELAETLDVGGVFFKRWAYRGERSLEIAPLILAGDMRWYPETSETRRPVSRADVMTALLGGLLLGVVGIWVAWRTIQQVAPKRSAVSRNASGKIMPGSGSRLLLVCWLATSLCAGDLPTALGFSSSDLESTRDRSRGQEIPWTRPDSPAARPDLTAILELYGVASSDLASMAAEETTGERREKVLLSLLYFLPRLTPADWDRWNERQPSLADLAGEAARFRGTAITLRGRATQAVARPVPRASAETLEFSRYWEVTLELTDDEGSSLGQAKVFARKIPEAWQEGELDEVAEMSGAFLDAVRDDQRKLKLVAATSRFAWFPDRIRDAANSAAHPVRLESLALAAAGVDHALWDDVRKRQGTPLEGPDRELFYQVLSAVGRQDTVALARRHGQPMNLGDLLLRPGEHQGALLTLTAFARRITKVLVEDMDIRERFGIDSYFQIDALIELRDQQIRLEPRQPGMAAIYTDKFPMTFCTRQLPKDLETLAEESVALGSERPLINERIEVAGFFLKTWPFRSEFLLALNPDQRHPSPLLLGTRPVRTPSPPVTRDSPLELSLAGLFVLALLGVTYWMWRWQRQQQRHFASLRRQANPRSLPPGDA